MYIYIKKTIVILLVVAFLLSGTATTMSTKDCENGEISTGADLVGIPISEKKSISQVPYTIILLIII